MQRQQKVLLSFLVIVILLFYGTTTVTTADDLTITHAYSLYSGSEAVDFGPNGNYIATGDIDGDVGFWEVGNDEAIDYINLGGEVQGVTFSPDGRYLAADGDDGNVIVDLLDVATRTIVRSRYVHDDADTINSIAYSHDGRYVAVGVDLTWAFLWDLNSGERNGWGITDASEVYDVAFSPDGRYLATGNDNGDLTLWELNSWWTDSANKIDLKPGGNVRSVAFSPNGNYIAADGYDGSNTYVNIYNVSTGSVAWQIYSGDVRAIAFSPNGEYIALGDDDATITFYKIGANPTHVGEITASGEVFDLAWSPDGTMISDGRDVWNVTYQTPDPPDNTDTNQDPDVTVSFSPSAVQSPTVGELLTLSLTITDGENVSGYQATVNFDTTALKYVQSANGDYLPAGAFFIPPKAEGGIVTLAATSLSGESNGDGTLATITFEVIAVKTSTLTLSDVLLTDSAGRSSTPQIEAIQITEPEPILTPPSVSDTTVSFTPSTVSSPAIGEQLTLSLNITGGENVSGYQATVNFDTTALEYVQSANGDYLPAGAFFIPPKAEGGTVTLAATSLSGESNGDGTLATITFEVVAVKDSKLTLSDVLLTNSAGESSQPLVEATQITESSTLPDGIGLTLPADIISEVAYTPNSTYFIVNAKYPMMTGVSGANILYGSCIITLHIPDSMQGFVFPIKTKVEEAQDDAQDIIVNLILSLGEEVIPFVGTLVDVLDLFSKVDDLQNRDLKIELQTAARHKEPPETEMECIVLLKHPENERPNGIDITIEQQYRDTDRGSTRIFKVSESKRWNFDDGWAAPPVQVTVFDYPAFQLLPAEVQQYLLLQFSEFGTTESRLIPKETALLVNYPNPFNPETWIPYQLATPADVSISIYTADGKLVQTLDLGHRQVGIYKSRSRAAYWDGKNTLGEPVASGLYLYTLTADDFTATRKMLIRK